MMVLPEASAPPAVGVKVNVAATPVLAATRSGAAMANVTTVTAPPITPDETDAEAVASTLVITLTLPPALAAPKVKPESVTVTAVLAASVVPPVVMTMEVALGATADRDAPPDTAAERVGLVAKKPNG